jgi:hypothetical protein
MIVPLLCASGLLSATVLIHALGTLEAIAHVSRVWPQSKGKQGLLISELHIVRVVAGMLLLHFIEAGTWAAFFWMSRVLPGFEPAFYFSITSYTTVGYGDVLLPERWRLLGPIEAAVGILMFGWSTAIIVAVVTRIHRDRLPVHT